MEGVICQTSDRYNVHAIGLKGGEIYAMAVGWEGEDTRHCYCQVLHDDSIAIEWGNELADRVDRWIVLSEMQEEDALFIAKVEDKAFVTESSTEYCNVTDAYYLYNCEYFAPYLFWSYDLGLIAGPGSEVSLKELLPEPGTQLWPIFEEAGIESIQKLRQVLNDRQPRQIELEQVLTYSGRSWGIPHCFGCYGPDSEFDLYDAHRWIYSLSGQSLDELRQAELDTIEQIDLWLKSKAAA